MEGENSIDALSVVKDRIKVFERMIISLLDETASFGADIHAAIASLKNESQEIESDESSYTKITNRELKLKLSCDRGLSRLIVVRSGFSIFSQTEEDDTEASIIVTSDGSLLSTNGRRTAAGAIAFKNNSPLNFTVTVGSKRSSTVPEIIALIEAISYAKINKLKCLTLCSDSSAAIKFVAEALVLPVSGSLPLQKAVSLEGLLAAKFAKIHGAHNFFTQLIIVHQVLHQNIYDDFSELNSVADSLAKSHARELAANSLPVTTTPLVSFEVARSPADDLDQVSTSMTRNSPTLSPLEADD